MSLYKDALITSRIGIAKGKFAVPDDLDRDNEEIEALFGGRETASVKINSMVDPLTGSIPYTALTLLELREERLQKYKNADEYCYEMP